MENDPNQDEQEVEIFQDAMETPPAEAAASLLVDKSVVSRVRDLMSGLIVRDGHENVGPTGAQFDKAKVDEIMACIGKLELAEKNTVKNKELSKIGDLIAKPQGKSAIIAKASQPMSKMRTVDKIQPNTPVPPVRSMVAVNKKMEPIVLHRPVAADHIAVRNQVVQPGHFHTPMMPVRIVPDDYKKQPGHPKTNVDKSGKPSLVKMGDNSIHTQGVEIFQSSRSEIRPLQNVFRFIQQHLGSGQSNVVYNEDHGQFVISDRYVYPGDGVANAANVESAQYDRFIEDNLFTYHFRLIHSDSILVRKLDPADVEGQCDPKNVKYTLANKVNAALTRIGRIDHQSMSVIAAQLLTQMDVYDAIGLFVPPMIAMLQLVDIELHECVAVANAAPAGNRHWHDVSQAAGVATWLTALKNGELVLIASDFSAPVRQMIDLILAPLPRFTNQARGAEIWHHVAENFISPNVQYHWIDVIPDPGVVVPGNINAASWMVAMTALAEHIGQLSCVCRAATRASTIINGNQISFNERAAFVMPVQPDAGTPGGYQEIDVRFRAIVGRTISDEYTLAQLMVLRRAHEQHCDGQRDPDNDPCPVPNCMFGNGNSMEYADADGVWRGVVYPYDRMVPIVQAQNRAIYDREWDLQVRAARRQHEQTVGNLITFWETASFERGGTTIPRYHDSNSIWRILKYGGSYRVEEVDYYHELAVFQAMTPKQIAFAVVTLGAMIQLSFSTIFNEQNIKGDTLDELHSPQGNDVSNFPNHFQPWISNMENRGACGLYVLAVNAVSSFTSAVVGLDCFQVPQWCAGFTHWDDRMKRWGWRTAYRRVPYYIMPLSLGWLMNCFLDIWGMVRIGARWDVKSEVIQSGGLRGFSPDLGESKIATTASSVRPYMYVSYVGTVVTALLQHLQMARTRRIQYTTYDRSAAGRALRSLVMNDPVMEPMVYYAGTHILKPGQIFSYDWDMAVVISPYLSRDQFNANGWARIQIETTPDTNLRAGVDVRQIDTLCNFEGAQSAWANWNGASASGTRDPEN